MTYQQPGAYPGVPPYPGGAGLPPKPPAPQSVRRAFQCMIGGAVLSVISTAAVFTQLDSIRSAFEKGLPNHRDTVHSLVTATVVAIIVFALIEAGLWLWIAFAAKAGKNYARTVGTVFFGVNAANMLFETSKSYFATDSSTTSGQLTTSETVLGRIVGWLILLVGLAAVVLLWRKSSSGYFKPEQFYPAMPYGYAGYAYGYPGYPPYGQGAPMQAPYPAAPYAAAPNPAPGPGAPYAAPTQEPQSPPPGPPQG